MDPKCAKTYHPVPGAIPSESTSLWSQNALYHSALKLTERTDEWLWDSMADGELLVAGGQSQGTVHVLIAWLQGHQLKAALRSP